MDLILSLDTEDYVTPEAADAQLWWAQALRERGVRGCFQCVAHLIRVLRQRGRTDVIEALSWHEIGHHSLYHSQQPTIPEQLENLSLAEGIAAVLRSEAAAFEVLTEAFGRVPVSYCSPGDSWTPATLLAMAASGIKVFCNDVVPARGKRATSPYWYCGLLTTAYNMAFESYFSCVSSDAAEFHRQFAARRPVTGNGVMTIYTHPTRLVTREFWDKPAFGGRRVSLEDWPPAPLHSPAQIQDNKDRASRWLDWLVAQPNIRIIDFATLYAERSHRRRTLGHLLDECGLAPGQEGLLPLRPPAPDDRLATAVSVPRAYSWGLYSPGFRGERLIEQARNLAWTAAPARRQPEVVTAEVVGGQWATEAADLLDRRHRETSA